MTVRSAAPYQANSETQQFMPYSVGAVLLQARRHTHRGGRAVGCLTAWTSWAAS